MKRELEYYLAQRRKMLAMRYVDFVIGWDSQTDAAENSILANSEQSAVLSEMQYVMTTDPKFEKSVECLYQNRDKLDEVLRHEIEEMHKDIANTKKIPMEEYSAYSELCPRRIPSTSAQRTKTTLSFSAPIWSR